MVAPSPATISFDAELFGADVIKRAAYTLANVASVEIRKVEKAWLCELRFLQNTDPATTNEIVESFRIEVLDQELRRQISEETAPVRNAILAVAFSRTGLSSSE